MSEKYTYFNYRGRSFTLYDYVYKTNNNHVWVRCIKSPDAKWRLCTGRWSTWKEVADIIDEKDVFLEML